MYTTDQSVRAIGRVRVAFATLGGAWLAMVAGYVDAVFFRLAGTAVTHVTGNAALFSADAAASNFDQAAKLGAIVGAFVLGAVLSGVLQILPDFRMFYISGANFDEAVVSVHESFVSWAYVGSAAAYAAAYGGMCLVLAIMLFARRDFT